jgi:hypothetical protein
MYKQYLDERLDAHAVDYVDAAAVEYDVSYLDLVEQTVYFGRGLAFEPLCLTLIEVVIERDKVGKREENLS